MNGLRKCGIYIQWNKWNFIQSHTKKKNEISSFAGKWMELEKITLMN
jgi:hypothetical protein